MSPSAFQIRMVFFFRADLLYLFQFCGNLFFAIKYKGEKVFYQIRLVRVIMFNAGYWDQQSI